jgi:Ferredoxin-dependent bilin reductase
MTAVWNKVEELARQIENRFNVTGEPIVGTVSTDYSWHNQLWSSPRYRRAHIEIVDNRETHKLYILHCTIFPHFNDPSPIWGFDAVCGPNKITGAFCDFSAAGESNHAMMSWFGTEAKKYGWQKPRELPEWARNIFSDNMVAAGNVQEGQELDDLCQIALDSLDYYLKNVGNTQQDTADYHMAQNRYCRYQKQNPHVIRSMVSMGVEEPVIRRFVSEVLFPEVV